MPRRSSNDAAIEARKPAAQCTHTVLPFAYAATSSRRSWDIPLRFLLGILDELRRARLVMSQRGIQDGYALARPAAEINLADVLPAIDGPLVSVHDESVSTMRYPGPAAGLRDVWTAVRSSLRSVLELVSIADLVSGDLPPAVRRQVVDHQDAEATRGRSVNGAEP